MSLRLKLFSLSFLIAMAFLAAISVAVFFKLQRQIINLRVGQLEQIADIQKLRFNKVIENYLSDLSTLLSLKGLPDLVNTATAKKETNLVLQIAKGLKDALLLTPTVVHISVLDKSGNVIVSTESASVGENRRDTGYFQRGNQEPSLYNVFKDNQGRMRVRLVGPLIVRGILVGVLEVIENGNPLLEIVEEYTGLAKTEEIFVAQKNQRGDALLITPLRFDKDAALYRTIPKENASDPIFIALSGNERVIFGDDVTDYREHPVMAATRFIPATKWGLVAKIDLEEALLPVYQLLLTLLAIGGVCTVLAVAASCVVARTLTDPIMELTKAADNLAKSDFSQRVLIKTDDEIGHLSAAFNTMAAELEKTDRIRTEFITTASHQLRTPLTGMLWLSERFLKRAPLSKEGEEYLTKIIRSTRRLNEFVSELLNVSRMEKGASYLSLMSIDVVAFMKDYLLESSPSFERKQITLTLGEIPKTLQVITDPSMIRNIVHSLVANAIEYTPEGGAISVAITLAPLTFSLMIQDSGIGIPQDSQRFIFERFFRGPNARTVRTDGTGLGLYLAKESVLRLGGKIWFTSKENQGATFYVELPFESSS